MPSVDPEFTLANRVRYLRDIDSHTWPLILLTELNDASKYELIQKLRPKKRERIKGSPTREEFQTWTPSTSALASMAQQGPHRDSQANLYAIAVLAYQSGHSKILVADELSKRQLNGNLRHGESQDLSVIIILVRPERPAHLSVWARRVVFDGQPIEDTFTKALQDWKYAPDPEVDRRFKSNYLFERGIWEDRGLRIHDPDRLPFSRDSRTSVGWDDRLQAIGAALPRLPSELVQDIIARTGGTQVVEQVVWENCPTDDHLVIFLLFPATPDHITEMKGIIEGYLSKDSQRNGLDGHRETTFELVPWEKHSIRSRRSLMDFWLFYHSSMSVFSQGKLELHLMIEPIQKASTFCFVRVVSPNASVGIARRLSLSAVIRAKSRKYFPSTPVPERVCNSDEPFYYVFAPWQTANQAVYGWSKHNGWLPAFYLTNRLTKEQDQEIRAKIKSSSSRMHRYIARDFPTENKHCGFIPWKPKEAGDLDGTVQDIWELAQQVELASYRREKLDFICIDQQSAIDKKVIFVEPKGRPVPGAREFQNGLKDLSNPRLQGLTFARVRAENAHIMLCAADDHEKWASGYGRHALKHFIRPDIRPAQVF